MKKPSIIGIYSPFQNSGKTTLADTLLAESPYDHDSRLLSFADGVRRMARKTLVGFGWDTLEAIRALGPDKDREIEDTGLTGRDILISIGEAARETLWESVWVERLMHNVYSACSRDIFPESLLFIVDDVRKPIEYHALKNEGATMVHLSRPGWKPASYDARTENLLADTDSYPFDVYLNSSESLEDTKEAARYILRRHSHNNQ